MRVGYYLSEEAVAFLLDSNISDADTRALLRAIVDVEAPLPNDPATRLLITMFRNDTQGRRERYIAKYYKK
jgi:hypothetical protein